MPQKKLFAALLVAASALLMLGMSNENQIPYPSNYDTKSAGASSYNGLANVPKSPYFQQLDFYNMQPTDSLVLLPKFRTYQQTTEYTCGPAAALMVVEHFQGRRRKMNWRSARSWEQSPIPGLILKVWSNILRKKAGR